MDEAKHPGIRLVQVFLEKASFKHGPGFLDLPQEAEPNVKQLAVSLETGLTADKSAALIRARVRTKPRARSLYEFDVTMTALFERDAKTPNMPLDQYVSMAGWTLIFPFLREAVANITTRGRFGPVWLNPFNLRAHAKTDAQKSPAGG